MKHLSRCIAVLMALICLFSFTTFESTEAISFAPMHSDLNDSCNASIGKSDASMCSDLNDSGNASVDKSDASMCSDLNDSGSASVDKSEDILNSSNCSSNVVLTLPVGKGSGEISYLMDEAYVIGPTDYYVVSNDEFYVLNSHKNEIIYAKGGQVIDIYDISFCKKPTKLTLDENKLYILDLSSIFVLNILDKGIEKIELPKDVSANSIDILNVSRSHIYLQTFRGDAYELFENKSSISNRRNEITVHDDQACVQIEEQVWCFEITNAFVNTIGVNNDVLYVLIGEHSTKSGDMTCSHSIRKYSSNGTLLGLYQYDESALVCISPKYFRLGADGEVYVLECFQDKVCITRIDINGIQTARMSQDTETSDSTETKPTKSRSTPPPVSLSRTAVKARADCNQQLHQWVYIGADGYKCSVCSKISQYIFTPYLNRLSRKSETITQPIPNAAN